MRPTSSLSAALSLSLGFAIGACGSSSNGAAPGGTGDGGADATHDGGGGDDADAAQDASVDASDSGTVGGYPAAHPPMPQVLDAGGPVMKTPKFVVITFAGDALAAQIDDFSAKVAASATYWSGTTAEYGVGPVASVLDISVTDTPATNLADGDVQAWLTSKLSGPDAGILDGGAPWPQPDADTIYMIYYPSSVTITQGGGTSCNQFYGYHGDYALSAGKYVTYSVIARCPAFPGTSDIDSIAAIASHEYVEAATDPLQENPAYSNPDPDHAAWATLAGGELGDMCAGFGNVFYKPADVPYLVQRTWSNKAAAASLDPCQPGGVTPNFNAAAVLNDTVTFSGAAGAMMTKGVKIPVGSTGTVELDLYSSAPTSGPWTVQAYDGASYLSMGGAPPELAVSFPGGASTATGKNGDKLQLTIKVLTADPSGAELFMLVSTLGTTSNAPQTYWIGLVGN
jgi:hypothetical protein